MDRIALHIADDRNGDGDPDVVTPRVTVPPLDLVATNLAREEPLEVVRSQPNILGVRDCVQGGGLQIALRITSDSAQRVVDLQPRAVHVDDSHADRGIDEPAFEALAHLTEMPLHLRAFFLRSRPP